jgi:hypothetical protein
MVPKNGMGKNIAMLMLILLPLALLILLKPMPNPFTKPEVIPKVWPNQSPSLSDVQNMINSTLERQAKSTDELLHRLIEERDGKKHSDANVNSSSTCTVNFAQTNAEPLYPVDESLP